VARACNPSYSRDRDQEDHGSRPAQANSSSDPILEKPNTKKRRAGEVTQVVEVECLPSKHEALSSNPSAAKKKKMVTRNLGRKYVDRTL
jgi:hypothetical protein